MRKSRTDDSLLYVVQGQSSLRTFNVETKELSD